jgi:hypothetical protein
MTGEAGKWMIGYQFTHKKWEIFSVQSGGNFADNRRRQRDGAEAAMAAPAIH